MKDYRIEYQDKDQNELFIGIVTAVDLARRNRLRKQIICRNQT
jgi:hypothetical protein